MKPDDLATFIHERLHESQDPDFAAGQRRFFKHEIDTYGVRTKELHALAREVTRTLKPWPPAHRNRALTGVWKLRKLEAGILACYVYRRFARTCGACEFKLFESWLDRYVDNWASTDALSTWLLAASIGNEPALRFNLLPWTQARNLWKRRASAVALLQEAKKGRHQDFVFEIAARLLPDRADMVEKGVGWLLKEAYPKQPRATVAFLVSNRQSASRLTLRYACEKMSPSDKQRVLSL
jgi:3-methyladenine DNA glycosylase AlkD